MKNNLDSSKPNVSKSSRFKWILLLTVVLVLFSLTGYWCMGLFQVPDTYQPIEPIESEQVSQYLTNYVLPQLHNKAQYGEPFELAVSQEGLNDIIARHLDSKTLKKASIDGLSVSFEKEGILLSAKTDYRGIDLVATMVLEPVLDERGKFYLNLSKFRAGKSSLPFVTEKVKKKLLGGFDSYLKDSNNSGFVKALLGDGEKEPTFKVNHSKLTIRNIKAGDKKIIIDLLPAQNE